MSKSAIELGGDGTEVEKVNRMSSSLRLESLPGLLNSSYGAL